MHITNTSSPSRTAAPTTPATTAPVKTPVLVPSGVVCRVGVGLSVVVESVMLGVGGRLEVGIGVSVGVRMVVVEIWVKVGVGTGEGVEVRVGVCVGAEAGGGVGVGVLVVKMDVALGADVEGLMSVASVLDASRK